MAVCMRMWEVWLRSGGRAGMRVGFTAETRREARARAARAGSAPAAREARRRGVWRGAFASVPGHLGLSTLSDLRYEIVDEDVLYHKL